MERNLQQNGNQYKITLYACVCVLLFSMLYISSIKAESVVSAPLEQGQTENGVVRVYLTALKNYDALSIRLKGAYTAVGDSEKSFSEGEEVIISLDKKTGQFTLMYQGETYAMGNKLMLRRQDVYAASSFSFIKGNLKDNTFPGNLELKTQKQGASYQLYPILHIFMEDYLLGVVPFEMGDSAPLEALKAQAVAARTYTFKEMKGHTDAHDVVDNTNDQVYKGTPKGHPKSKQAVQDTEGIVLFFEGQVVRAWYTASNGGQIESAKNIFGGSNPSYIKIKEDPFDFDNPQSKVHKFFINKGENQENKTFSTLLNNKIKQSFGEGATLQSVQDVVLHTPMYPAPSKLYTQMDVLYTVQHGGETKESKATFSIFDEIEQPLKMSIQKKKNELYSVWETQEGFSVEARRYGHGTGMSQRGAMQMGAMDYTYDEILGFYFEGAKRTKLTFLRE